MPTKSITLRETRFVPMAATEAVQHVADFHRIREWDPSILTSVRTDAGPDAPLAVGATFDLSLEFLKVRSEMTYRMVELTPFRARLDGASSTLTAIDVVEAIDVAGGAEVTWTATLDFSGMAAVALPLLRPALKRLGVDAVDGLARWLTELSQKRAA